MPRTELIRPLPELLRQHAERLGDKVAFRDSRRSVSYAELEARTRRLAGHLAGRWLQPGDPAAIYLGNRVETVESYLAIARASGIGVPLNPNSTDTELAYLLGDSGARVVITDRARVDQVMRARPDGAEVRALVVDDDEPGGVAQPGVMSFATLAATDPSGPAPDDLGLDDVAWCLYTSGTTGMPKGVLSTQRNCLWSVAACYVPVPGLSADDRVVWPLPLFHSLSHIACVLGVTAVGASARIVDGFAADEILQAIQEESATFLAGVPSMYHYLVRAAGETGFRAPSLRMCLVGGAITTASLRESFGRTFQAPLLDAYGSTETCGSITISRPDGARGEGSSGLPVPGLEVRLADPETGRQVGAGEEGEVWVKGPNVMIGYHNKPRETAAVLRDGWYRTGDLARRDRSGYVTISGRIKELIIRGGENIHPGEVEELLRGAPGVLDAAVAGKAHEVLGEVPVAFLVRGQERLDPQSLLALCRERLSTFKIPEELFEIAEVPRTQSGKIKRHALFDQPSRLLAVSNGHYESLLRWDWTPVPAGSAPAVPARRWAVAGPAAAGLLDGLGAMGVDARPYPGTDAMRQAIAHEPPPDVVAVAVPGTGDSHERTGFPDGAATRAAADALSQECASWLANGRLATARLIVLTQRAMGTGSAGDVPDITQSVLGEAVRRLQASHPGRLALIDLDAADPAAGAAVAAAASLNEPLLAVRSGVVLRPALARVPATVVPDPRTGFDPERTVVIAGADNAAAGVVAHHLVSAYGARRLLLISGRGEADEAVAGLASGLRQEGISVTVAACDVADRQALAEALDGAHRPFAAMVHMPGRLGDGSPELATSTADGAVNLSELTDDDAVPPVPIFFSSFPASAVGEPEPAPHGGDIGAAAAAAVVAALAQQRHAQGRQALSLAWGPWEAWQWTGADSDRRSWLGMLGTQQGLAAFDAALLAGGPVLAAVKLDLLAPDRPCVPAMLSGLVDAVSTARTTDRDRAVELRDVLRGRTDNDQLHTLLGIVLAEAGKVRDLGGRGMAASELAFRDLGFTSADAIELRNRVSSSTGLELSAALSFDYPTPALLARHLLRQLTGSGREPAVPAGPITASARDAGLSAREVAAREPVAIVGAGCRLPGGVVSPEGLWELVSGGVDAVGEFPGDRGWDLDAIYDPDPDRPGKTYVRAGGFLAGAAGFDAGFFGVSPREALAMDPQQRLLLELAWESFERAGIDPGSARGSRTGVYAGLMHHDYGISLSRGPMETIGYRDTGNAGSVATGRVSYVLGLEGPAVTVDTACSSSLVAMHLAVQALRSGEVDMALAGGVTVMATPGVFVEFSQQRALAPDGRCKAFAAGADGTGWSEGAGLVLLERLSDARAAGHRVWGLVVGSAVNQDGASNGLTAPNGPSQERVIGAALAAAGVGAGDVDAVEAHGTGTRLGDPIEALALAAAYGRRRGGGEPLWVGSLKSNIGHAQAAAGVAGVIKMVMALRRGVLPATLHVDRPTPEVEWEGSGLGLLTGPRPWPGGGRPRRAGVSSFGVSGTNAHLIVEEAPPDLAAGPDGAGRADGADGADAAGGAGGLPGGLPGGVVPLVVSAKSAGALAELAGRLAGHVGGGGGLADAGYSLAVARARLAERAVVIAGGAGEARAGLAAVAAGDPAGRAVTGTARGAGKTAFVFPGQGSQWAGMGRGLLAWSPVFAEAIAECERALAPHVDWSLAAVLGQEAGAPSLDRVDVVQPVTFAVMAALARLWEHYGVRPDAVIGHSQGEIAAAYVAGALTLEDAAAVAALRSQAIAATLAGHGGMVSVGLPLARVRALLDELPGDLEVAAVNSPASVVVAGEPGPLEELAARCQAGQAHVRQVKVDYASHSAQVERIREDLAAVLGQLRPGRPRIPMFSTVDAAWVTDTALDGRYWYRNLRQAVRFADGVRALAGEGYRVLIEVSPHPVLAAAVEETLDHHDVDAVVAGTLRRGEDSPRRVAVALAEVFVRGAGVDWGAWFAGSGARVGDLPTYPFQRDRYWLAGGGGGGDVGSAGLAAAGHPLLGAVADLAGGRERVFFGRLSAAAQPWLADHRVAGTMVVPGSALADMLGHIGAQVRCPEIEELICSSPIIVPGNGIDLQFEVSAPAAGGHREVGIYARTGTDEPWAEHASSHLRPSNESAPAAAGLPSWPPAGADPVDLEGFYERLNPDYGPAFHAVRAVWTGQDEVFAEVSLPDDVLGLDADRYGVHPILMDAALHPLALAGFFPDPGQRRMAFSWTGVRLYATGARSLRVRLSPAGPDAVSLELADDSGAPVLTIESLVVRPVDADKLRAADAVNRTSLYEVGWRPAPSRPVPAQEWARLGGLGDGPVPAMVVYEPDSDDPGQAVPQAAHAVGLRTLRILRDWLSDSSTADSLLAVVTRSGDLAHGAVQGLVRAAQTENPGRFVLLEIDEPGSRGISTGLAASTGSDEPEVMVRNGQPYIRRLDRGRAAAGAAGPELAGGTVLITGATGGLGRLVTEHLVLAHGVTDLVLVSRSGTEDRWEEELSSLGASVRMVRADVADRAAMADLVSGIKDRLVAVIHAAGIVDDGVVTDLTTGQWDAVLRPKVDGAWHLHELTAELDLKAFVLFSSASAAFGGAGQGNYAAGNAFLDALARHRDEHGLPATSLSFGMWGESSGMGGRLSETDIARMGRYGTVPLSADQGLALFDAALTTGRPAVVPIQLDLAKLRAAEEVPALMRDLVPSPARRAVNRAGGQPDTTRSGLARRLAGLPEAERGKVLADLVRGTATAVLGHAGTGRVDAGKTFKDLGFDSLTGVELRNKLAEATGLRLPAGLVFNYPTPQELTEYLRTELAQRPEASPPPNAQARTSGTAEPIAIVAMSCRLPGGLDSPEELWQFVASGGDAITGFPSDRGWDLDAIYDPDPDRPGKTYVRAGGFLAGAAGFDAGFFGVSPREALAMDPQQRLLLELAWEALERGGVDPTAVKGTPTGVFVGTHGQDYGRNPDRVKADEGYLVIGTAASVLSGRVAHVLGLEGPAVTVDTACSSSLVAMHLAAQALRSGEVDMALAGGISIMSSPDGLIGFSRQRALAPDGRCKAFAAAADGFGMSEGAGLVLLERLSDARAAGHRVWGLVVGSAVNQDGASNGLTAPNGPSQERVIGAALAAAGVGAGDVDAVEAHGTGTRLGDPIEALALAAAYGRRRGGGEPLWVGSLKSNIGHAQAAAGVAGVIKMVMALRRGVLPATLHVDRPTPEVEWEGSGLGLLTGPRPWPGGGRPRRAGVSSFGVSGTNAHLIVEEAPPELAGGADGAGRADGADGADAAGGAGGLPGGVVPLVVSAKSAGALAELAGRLAGHVGGGGGLADAGYSLAVARARLAERAVVIAGGAGEARAGLAAVAAGDPAGRAVTGTARGAGKTAFVFPGQGSQWAGMGRGLLAWSPVFAEAIAECERALAPHVDWSLAAVLGQEAGAPSLDRVDVVQPVTFAVMAALARLWEHYGVRPDAVIGHSQGEIAAAYVAGALTLEDAAAVAALRSQAIAATLAGHGGMVSVGLPLARVRALLDELPGDLEVAAVNSPASVVVAGEPGPLEELAARCQAGQAHVRQVKVDYASHSAQVERIREDLAAVLGQLRPGRPADTDVLHRGRGLGHGHGAGRAVLVPQPAAGRAVRRRGPGTGRRGIPRPDRGQPAPGSGRGGRGDP